MPQTATYSVPGRLLPLDLLSKEHLNGTVLGPMLPLAFLVIHNLWALSPREREGT
jgi:hypothetical protein